MSDTAVSNKTIALVSNTAWSVYNYRIDVIRHLKKAGCRIVVIATEDDYAAKLTAEGCLFFPLAFNNRDENPLHDYFLYRKLQALYRRIRPDFIFHYVAKPNIYGSIAAGAEKIPSAAFVTGLGYPFAKRNLLFSIMKLLYRKALRNVETVFFLNNEDAEVFVSEKIIGNAKTKVLPGEGVNTEYFFPIRQNLAGTEHNVFRFLMVSRLLKSKGVSLYAEAARMLRKKNYRISCALAGFYEKNHPDSIMPGQISNWEKEGLISFHGFNDDVRPLLGSADCFVFPSFYSEGIPRCMLEAASMELPIITSRNRGCREVVVENWNGLLCNVANAEDLAEKMERMIHLAEAERAAMGVRGRELVIKKFGIDKIIPEYMNVLISAFENNDGSNS